jgi:hypothetical protein
MFYQAYSAGFDTAAPASEVKNGIEVYKEYKTESGSATVEAGLGDKLEVHIRLRANGGAIKNVAVVDLLPGGFAVVNERPAQSADAEPAPRHYGEGEEGGDGGGEAAPDNTSNFPAQMPPAVSGKSGWHPDYVDVREDRVVAYGTIEGDVEFVYLIQAENKGVFGIPPAFCQSIYDRTVNGINPSGKQITVK